MVVIMRRYMAWVVWLILTILTCGFPALAQSQQPDQPLSGSINGTVVDQTGAVVAGAPVRLSREDQSPNQEVLSGDDGQFSFADIAPGPFQLTITAAGFATQTFSGILHSEEIYVVPQIKLAVAAATTEVRVVPSRTEVAEDQIKDQEKQRVLGLIPNFYVRRPQCSSSHLEAKVRACLEDDSGSDHI